MNKLIAANIQSLADFRNAYDRKTLSFWDRSHPLHEKAKNLFDELVPARGYSDTVEGECIRAAYRMMHDAFNNGFGNNYSGALIYLRQNFTHPDMDAAFSVLKNSVSGAYTGPTGQAETQYLIQEITKSILATETRHPNSVDMFSLNEDTPEWEEEDEEWEEDNE